MQMKQIEFTVKYPCEREVNLSTRVGVAMTDIDILEQIFAWFNAGSNRECDAFLSQQMRSLSSNDFVCLNGQWWQCMNVGWEKVTQEFVDAVCAEVRYHPDYLSEARSAWSALDRVMSARRQAIKENKLKIFFQDASWRGGWIVVATNAIDARVKVSTAQGVGYSNYQSAHPVHCEEIVDGKILSFMGDS